MKNLTAIFAAVTLLVLFTGSADAQTQNVGPKSVKGTVGPNWVDADGDGICDNFGQNNGQGKGLGQGRMNGKGFGPKDGTGNHGVRPQDGTGYGRGAGMGQCDGTGPKGMQRRGGNQTQGTGNGNK